jgi:hypothetical protein
MMLRLRQPPAFPKAAALLVTLLLFGAFGTAVAPERGPAQPVVTARDNDVPVLGPSGHYATIQVSETGTKHLVPLHQIVDGGPGKDGIPSIDNPTFVGAE